MSTKIQKRREQILQMKCKMLQIEVHNVNQDQKRRRREQIVQMKCKLLQIEVYNVDQDPKKEEKRFLQMKCKMCCK